MSPKWHGPIAGLIAAVLTALYTAGVDPGWHALDRFMWAFGVVWVTLQG